MLPARNPSWDETQTLIGPNGEIITISAVPAVQGGRTTARWFNNQLGVLGTDTSNIYVPASFVTPDGSLWNVSDDQLSRFSKGCWVPLPESAWPRPPGDKALDVGVGLRAADAPGPPWTLFDPENERLVRLSVDQNTDDVLVEVLPVRDGTDELRIWDMVKSANGELLLATNRGLRTFAPGTSKLESPKIDLAGREARRMCRDGLGRLWIAGTGLALIHAGGEKVDQFDDVLPMVGDRNIVAMSPDPDRQGGIFFAIEGRGVVAVQVAARRSQDR